MVKRKPRYRGAWLKAGRNEAVSRNRLVSASPVPTNKPHTQSQIIIFHKLVSTSFAGHLVPQLTQRKKVRGNSRLRPSGATGRTSGS